MIIMMMIIIIIIIETIAIQEKFNPTIFLQCIKFYQEFSISVFFFFFFFCESLLSCGCIFAGSASAVVTIPTFDNGIETI